MMKIFVFSPLILKTKKSILFSSVQFFGHDPQAANARRRGAIFFFCLSLSLIHI